MRCVMLMFDSLNRHMLPPYNADTWVHAPNFKRLAERTATFDTSYVVSMPCMPTRRDFQTGRLSFLHCGWGPHEPFDESVTRMLSQHGVHTHMDSDHYHYWEDGGATYHTKYNTWQFFRGQEGDPHIGQVADPPIPEHINGKGRRQDWVNRQYQRREQDLSQTQTIDAGIDFIERNQSEDNWFLQIECFDPHEPFVSHDKYRDLYESDYDGPVFDWPGYCPTTETPEQIAEARRNYAALLTKCDASLGELMDTMDRHDMWDDTMFILWTDHGFMLGEHHCWAKNWQPLYEEYAHTPLFVWDPRYPEAAGTRRQALVQPGIDLAPTLLRFFGVEPTEHMTGKDLAPVMQSDTAVRDAAIFGYWSRHVNVTDGRHVYMREPASADNRPLYAYTLMPNMLRGFDAEQAARVELAEPFGFTKGKKPLRIPMGPRFERGDDGAPAGHLLYDVKQDPQQQKPLTDEKTEQRLCAQMVQCMIEHEAPEEQYVRLGLEAEFEKQTGRAPAGAAAESST